MIIKGLLIDVYNTLCECYKGSDWASLCLPSRCYGCVDVELSNDVKIEIANNEPMIVIKFKRKIVRIPRYNYDEITIM